MNRYAYTVTLTVTGTVEADDDDAAEDAARDDAYDTVANGGTVIDDVEVKPIRD